jgi:predicted DNA-binding protein with PD1-like motif
VKSKQINENPPTYLLVFDRGDEVIERLTAFARDANILFASFHALGAFERATFAFWNWDTRRYEDIPIGEQVEVVSLVGNVARDEKGKHRVHAHVSLGKRDGSLIGGHLKVGIVRPTLELVLTQSNVEITRRRDDETGLPLITS